MKLKFILITLILSIPTVSQAIEVSQADWIKGMTTALPAMMCKEKSYFRNCYAVTAQECEKTALSATHICLEKNKDKMPTVFNQPEDGTNWGFIVGGCAGKNYDATFKSKKVNSDQCQKTQ